MPPTQKERALIDEGNRTWTNHIPFLNSFLLLSTKWKGVFYLKIIISSLPGAALPYSQLVSQGIRSSVGRVFFFSSTVLNADNLSADWNQRLKIIPIGGNPLDYLLTIGLSSRTKALR